MTTIYVAGFDPSFNNFGIVTAGVCIETQEVFIFDMELVASKPDKAVRKVVRKNSEDLARARVLQQAMAGACEGKTIAFAEVPVGSQSARAMASYGVCVGVLASCPIPLVEVTPSEVKMAGAGTKTASKDDMIQWAVAKHPNAPWRRTKRNGVMVLTNDNEHLADALAAIYAGMATEQFRLFAAAVRASVRGSLL